MYGRIAPHVFIFPSTTWPFCHRTEEREVGGSSASSCVSCVGAASGSRECTGRSSSHQAKKSRVTSLLPRETVAARSNLSQRCAWLADCDKVEKDATTKGDERPPSAEGGRSAEGGKGGGGSGDGGKGGGSGGDGGDGGDGGGCGGSGGGSGGAGGDCGGCGGCGGGGGCGGSGGDGRCLGGGDQVGRGLVKG